MRKQETWRLFWAKTDRDNPDSKWTRPLWAHLLDVAHTALLLWERFVPNSFQTRLGEGIGLDIQSTGRLLSFWIGLHDIGKAIPTFQALHPPTQRKLEEQGLSFRYFTVRKHHGHASIAILYQWLKEEPQPSAFLFEHIAAFVGFHHGRMHTRGEDQEDGWRGDASKLQIIGDKPWKEARFALLDAIRDVWFDSYPIENRTDRAGTLEPWLVGFAGWVTLADWLGSMANCFPRDVVSDPHAYLSASHAGAEAALHKAGFNVSAGLAFSSFEQLFPSYEPNPLQRTLSNLELPQTDHATLTIVEAPTGEGKTEAAFALAARLQSRHKRGGGLYVAMPTQATSNGLFNRTLAFLNRAHDATRNGPWANFRLVHGNADLHDQQESLVTSMDSLEESFDDEDKRDWTGHRVRTLRWFLQRKRSLLTPYGLGTVDQAFLGVLYARHFFLRLFGLAGKAVLFDEVHAYDLYMGRLFQRLLQWLHMLGTDVILLSATLPAQLRIDCFKAWQVKELPDIDPASVPYPAVWTAHNEACKLVAGDFNTSWSQHAKLMRHDPEPDAVAESVAKAIEAGATVGIICNTVKRAQLVYVAVKEKLAGNSNALLLFHARYRFKERNRREKQTLEQFGKNRRNGQGAALIATQVAEQSLDLDFDVLFTDLAPIDLLLQRAGRLHRHLSTRPPSSRPDGFQEPMVYWLCPENSNVDLPDLAILGIRSSSFSVYELLVVWKTWFILKDRTSWALPQDYRFLIEEVYNANQAPPVELAEQAHKQWQEAVRGFHSNEKVARIVARDQLIHPPTTEGIEEMVTRPRPGLADEDDENAHPTRRALTRHGADSIDVVLLYENDACHLFLDAALTEPAPLDLPEGRKDLPIEAVKQLLGNGVRLSYAQIVNELRNRDDDALPSSWIKAAAHTAALLYRHPLVLRDRAYIIAGYCIEDDDELGICINRVSPYFKK